MSDERKNNPEEEKLFQPDPETLHTPDPQKKMEGPVSSLMHETGKAFKTDTTKEEADEKRDKAL